MTEIEDICDALTLDLPAGRVKFVPSKKLNSKERRRLMREQLYGAPRDAREGHAAHDADAERARGHAHDRDLDRRRVANAEVGFGSMNETANAVACGNAPAALRQGAGAVNGM